ncbi:phosphate signaling complex protein PhoU [Bacteroidota bacterium]|nr:phosphate signaling complex protein PhoU [Bacteroidota bacterium]MDC3230073.1 phosphate signaling complex protein PhoU [Bacteroidota bacterium]|tara:strand:+ start:502 stop:1164 length:663 start_codon:yes stop_codon:yes gene_type:complete
MNTIDSEILDLKKELLKMFFLVESQWEKGATAILNYDQDMAEEISSSENRINAQELKIDSDCENIIALHSPVAVDLRFILSSYKINHSLEHIADIAQSIAKYVADSDLAYNQEIINQTKVNEMLETFNSMMDCLIDAFENEDPKIARKVFKKDKVLNKINAEAHKIIVDNMNSYDNGMLLFLLSSIRKIERAGDSLKKIGEEIIYHLEAKVLKHQKNKLD